MREHLNCLFQDQISPFHSRKAECRMRADLARRKSRHVLGSILIVSAVTRCREIAGIAERGANAQKGI